MCTYLSTQDGKESLLSFSLSWKYGNKCGKGVIGVGGANSISVSFHVISQCGAFKVLPFIYIL